MDELATVPENPATEEAPAPPDNPFRAMADSLAPPPAPAPQENPFRPLVASLAAQQPADVRDHAGAVEFLQNHIRTTVPQDIAQWGAAQHLGEGYTRPRTEYNGEDWPQLSAQIRQQFPEANTAALRSGYIDQRRAAFREGSLEEMAKRHAAAGMTEDEWKDYVRDRIPIYDLGYAIGTGMRYERSLTAIQEGRGSHADYSNVALHMARQDREKKQSFGAAAFDFATRLPAMAAEIYVMGGRSNAGVGYGLAGAAETSTATIARSLIGSGRAGALASQFAGGLARAGVQALPFTLPQAVRQAAPEVQLGGPEGLTVIRHGNWNDPTNLGRAFGHETVNMWVMGLGEVVGKAIGKASGAVVQRLASTAAGQRITAAATGMMGEWLGAGAGRTPTMFARAISTLAGARGAAAEIMNATGIHSPHVGIMEMRTAEFLNGLTGLADNYSTTGDLVQGLGGRAAQFLGLGKATDESDKALARAGRQLATEGLGFLPMMIAQRAAGRVVEARRRRGLATTPADIERTLREELTARTGQEVPQQPPGEPQAPQAASESPATAPAAPQATPTPPEAAPADRSGPGRMTSDLDAMNEAVGRGPAVQEVPVVQRGAEPPATVPTPQDRSMSPAEMADWHSAKVEAVQNDFERLFKPVHFEKVAPKFVTGEREARRAFRTILETEGPEAAQRMTDTIRHNRATLSGTISDERVAGASQPIGQARPPAAEGRPMGVPQTVPTVPQRATPQELKEVSDLAKTHGLNPKPHEAAAEQAAREGFQAGAAPSIQTAGADGGVPNDAPTPRVPGASVNGDTTVVLTHAGGVPGRYAAVELRSIDASHVMNPGGSFSPNERYPASLQPRDYVRDRQEQLKILKHSSKEGFNPDIFLSNDPKATDGPTTISPDGVAINGNGRALMLQRVANDGRFSEYKDALMKAAEGFGLDRKKLAGMKEPVLVRVVDMDGKGTEAKEFARQGNQPATGGQDIVGVAASLGNLISKETLNALPISDTMTFSEAVNERAGKAFRTALSDRLQAVAPAEVPRMFNPDGTLTTTGKEFTRKMLLLKLLPEETVRLLGDSRPRMLDGIEKTAIQLLTFEREGLGKLTEILNQGLEWIAKHPDVKDWDQAKHLFEQGSLFAGADVDTTAAGRAVIRHLLENAQRPNDIRAGLVKMTKAVTDATGLFGGDETPMQAIRDALNQNAAEAPKRLFSLTQQSKGEKLYQYGQGGGPGGGSAGTPAGPAPAAPRANTIGDAILKTFAPAARGKEAGTAGGIIRQNLAESVRKDLVAREAMQKASEFFDDHIAREKDEPVKVDKFLHFMDPLEGGTIAQDLTGGERAFAETARKLLDEYTDGLRTRSMLKKFIDNYVGHLWADPNNPNATPEEKLARIAARRPLAGGEGFKKKRSEDLPTYRDGLAAGLVPVDWNPAKLILLNLHEMNKSMMAHDIVQELKANGFWEYVRLGQRAPEDWKSINDKIASVFAPPEHAVKEYFDKQQMEQLEQFAKQLGVKVRTTAGGPPGASLGGEVHRRMGTPEEVLMHEIAHEIDRRYGLAQQWTNDPALKQELSALADLRASGQVDLAYKAYIQMPEEQIANAFAAYLHTPELLKQVAPNVALHMDLFLKSNPDVEPLQRIKPSLELGERDQLLRLAGPMLTGKYYTPEPVAALLDNHLSPGLRGNKAFDVVREFGNTINQAQLGFSFFHGGFVLMENMVSGIAMGLQQISRGDFAKGAGSIAGSPVNAWTNFVRGSKLLREYNAPGSQGGLQAQLMEAFMQGGGRSKMDDFYGGDHISRLRAAMKDVQGGDWKKGGNVLYHALPAFSELISKPVMEVLVPRIKMGVFAQMAEYELSKMPGADINQRREVLGKVWDSVENRLGQMTYDNLFWNRTLKDMLMVSTRSVGWNLGSIREFAGGIKDIPSSLKGIATGQGISPRTAYILALPMGTAFAGAIYQYLFGAGPPEEAKDYFFPRTGRLRPDGSAERMSLPSYMKDIAALTNRGDEGPLRWASNLWSMGRHKIHPAISTVAEMLENQNFYGRAIYDPSDGVTQKALDLATHLIQSFEPFSIRNAVSEGANPAALASFFGLTPAPAYVVHTAEEQRAAEQMRRHQATPLERRRQALAPDQQQEVFGTIDSIYQQAGQTMREPALNSTQRAAVQAWRVDVARVAHGDAPIGPNPFLNMDALPESLRQSAMQSLSTALGVLGDQTPRRRAGERVEVFQERQQNWQERQDKAERFLEATGLNRQQAQALMAQSSQDRRSRGERVSPAQGRRVQRVGR